MGPAISDILPLALGVAISPIPIIAVILMLFSSRARTNGPSFLAGWVLGLVLVCAIVSVIASTLDVGTDSSASDGTSTLKVALGLVLIIAGVRRWRHRPAPGAEEPMPKWMAAVDTVTPVKAVGLGVLLSGVNPKNLLLAVAAAATVAQANLSTSDTVITLAVFVVLSSLTIAVPVVFYLLGGDHAKTTLEGWKVWLAANNATVMALLFLVFGVVVFARGHRPTLGLIRSPSSVLPDQIRNSGSSRPSVPRRNDAGTSHHVDGSSTRLHSVVAIRRAMRQSPGVDRRSNRSTKRNPVVRFSAGSEGSPRWTAMP